MTVAAEDQLTPSMCEQPLTSGGHVYHAPPVLEEKYGDMKEAEGPLTTSDQEDCWPDSNNVTRSDQRLKKRKYLETAALYAAYFARGLSFGMQGPSILDLQLAVRTNTQTITRIFIGRSLGRLSGVLLSAGIMEKFEYYVPFAIATLVMTTFMAVLPWTWHIIIMAIALALSSVGNGFCDAAANVGILMIWDKENGPWMQALHLCLSLGALTGPLVVKSFLREVPSEEPHYHEGSNRSGANVTLDYVGETTTTLTTTGQYAINDDSGSPQYPDLGTTVWIPLLLFGVLGVIIAGYIISLYCTRPAERSYTTKRSGNVQGRHDSRNKVVKGFLIFFVYIFYTCHVATQRGFQSYIFAYVVDYHDWQKGDAALLTSVTFATFMLGRIVGILLIRCVRPSHMLVFDCVGLVLANIPLPFFSHSHVAVIWVSSALNGWFVSRLYATGITWLDCYVRLSGIVATVFMLAAASGDLVGPVVLTAFYGNYGLGAFGPLMFISSISVLLICVIVLFLAFKLGPQDQNTSLEIPDESCDSKNI